MLPAVLDSWAALARYEAVNVASSFPGGKVWLVGGGAKGKLQQVMMTIAQCLNFAFVPVDASASGLADAQVTANVLAETILNLAGLDRSRAESLCRAPGANLMLGPATSGFLSVVAGVGHRLDGRVDAPVTSLEAVEGTFPATRLVRSPAH